MWQIAVALLISGVAAVTAQCPDGNWTEHGYSCYKWFNSPNFWHTAEQTCLSHGAHLVSIRSEWENRLVGRLSNCTNTWIGRFGRDLHRLSNPTNTYEWTDGSDATKFHRHNFSQLDSIHKPLIRTDGERWLNSLYHESHPFVCKAQINSTYTDDNDNFDCPDGWSLFERHCYIIPNVESANFNEANFYCQSKSAQLVSVMSEAELRYINTLDLSSDSCETSLDTVWIGLIKLNPCFPDSAGRELCYQWTDFSGKHAGFPNWETGHPNAEDWTVNCVTLRGDRLHSDRCHNRHKFVCKAPASNDTEVVAAFDFRKGLQNLVDPVTYPVLDEFDIPRNSEDGACFNNTHWNNNKVSHYRIGDNVNLEQGILAEKQWTLFFRIYLTAPGGIPHDLVAITNESLSGALHDGSLHLSGAAYQTTFRINLRVRSRTSNTTVQHFGLRGDSFRNGTQNDFSIAMKAGQPLAMLNGERFIEERRYNTTSRDFNAENHQLLFGINGRFVGTGCIRCFGLSQKQLLKQVKLRQVFSRYCD